MNRKDRRASQSAANRLGLRYACQACGARILDVPVLLAKRKPAAASRMLARATEAHKALGCPAQQAEPGKSSTEAP